jgi:hypothetical protein
VIQVCIVIGAQVLTLTGMYFALGCNKSRKRAQLGHSNGAGAESVPRALRAPDTKVHT